MPEFRYRRFVNRERGANRTSRASFDDNEASPDVEEELQRSPGNFESFKRSPSWAVKDRENNGPKAASIAAALETFTERDFADPSKRKLYRALRNAQEASRQNIKSSATDRRFFNPVGHDWPYTVSGTAGRLSGFASPDGRALFKSAVHLIPCVQRAVRRSVLFAKGKGGKGYHTKKRRNSNSGVPC